MKPDLPLLSTGGRRGILSFALSLLLAFAQYSATAQVINVPLRRPISPQQPMWLIHIDSWNQADPQKIIDMVPLDVRPYVVFNISISINHDAPTGRWLQTEYAYETVKSWLRTCAENKVWAMVQQSSGGYQHFSETDLRVYEEFYRDYPNMIGYNYAEQFWGYGDANDQRSPSWSNRVALFANLLKLSNKYGGYLAVSWCGNQWSPNINPMAMMKLNPDFAAACKKYTKNYILCEKYTQQSYQSDMESLCLGAWLSGLSGQYGIRYDATGWTDSTGTNANFSMATSVAPHLEHIMLTGQTVIDGPETIPVEQTRELTAEPGLDGYTRRKWEFFPQFTNVSLDLFRKLMDGAVRIPSRQEVIDRTKLVITQNVNTGNIDDLYSTPATLFEGLYRMDGDGNLRDNKTFFKKTGRYPTIPVVYQLADAPAHSFSLKLNQSALASRWPTINAKVTELNSIFPAEYSGDLYAGRHENSWVVYNPFKTNRVANGNLPFQYNTCQSMELAFSQYSGAVVNEMPGQLKFYLNNYDNMVNTGLKTDVIKIYGSTTEPSWSFTDRANHQASSVTADWTGGIFTLTVKHNGPLDILVNCAGNATGRLSSYKVLPLVPPATPGEYAGPRQYEAECFDYRSIAGNTTNGTSGDIRNYMGQGYLRFGTNAAASVRKMVSVGQKGSYRLMIRYSATGASVTTVDLYINGTKVATPVFTQTSAASDWQVVTQTISLNAGTNTLALTGNAAATGALILDNIIIDDANADKYHFNNDVAGNVAANPPAYAVSLRSGTAGVTSYADGTGQTSNVFRAYSTGAVNSTGVADLELFASSTNYSIIWKEWAGAAGNKKGVLLRGTDTSSYATGLKQGYLFVTENNVDNTVTLRPYIVGASSITAQAIHSSGFTTAADRPVWYRATAAGNTLSFECSADSISWEGADNTEFTDNTYPGGSTQLVWGLGTTNFDWRMDNISFRSSSLSSNKLSLQGFTYVQDAGPSASQQVILSGRSLDADVLVKASAGYEVSLNANAGYAGNLTIIRVADSIPTTTVFVRLKAGLPTNTYKGDLMVGEGQHAVKVVLTGGVTLVKVYTFTDDIATTSASTPPASNVSVAADNTATAGVVSYTDAGGNTSNYLRPYAGGQRNATGVLNLELFDANAADYSVTWKQVIGLSATDYKSGMLLRGNEPAGTATTGYVQGIKQGYLFLAYNVGQTRTEFRIYKSTIATGLNTLVNNNVASLGIASGVPVWYRATATGSSSVSLRFEYSLDSLTWNIAAVASDGAASYPTGSTQMVWGLATANWSFYIDNITLNEAPQSADLTITDANPASYSYIEGAGPSTSTSFAVSGARLTDNIVAKAPPGFQISLNASTGFGETVVLTKAGTNLNTTPVYARLSQGLVAGNYQGLISFEYSGGGGGFDKVAVLNGQVLKPMISAATTSPLNNLGYVVSASYSTIRSFAVSGTTLSGNVEVNAPASYEISLNQASGYSSSLTLPVSNGNLASTIIYIRLALGMGANDYSGTVAISSAGSASKNLDISGKVTSAPVITSSATALNGLGYSTFLNNPPVKSFLVAGGPLTDILTLTAPTNYEISRTAGEHYISTLNLPVTNGTVEPTTIFVRLKANLTENSYTGNITLASGSATSQLVAVSGTVTANRIYDFSTDLPSTSPGTPPAIGITTGAGNSTTAGVVSYTDINGDVSNRFRPYSGGNRNATGALNLNLFPTDGTDYSITWRQYIGSGNTEYKAGVLLRGNAPVGDASTGYVQGIMRGYVFIAYHATGTNARTEFRIYRSTEASGLNTLVNISVNGLFPAAGHPLWYRATATGEGPVSLKFEYSLDSVTWNSGATATDVSSPFLSGSSQIIYGLGTPNYNFYMDNITYAAQNLTALPVHLLSFHAQEVNSRVNLNWQTVSEVNNKGFDIEHSTDGYSYKKVGYVPGNSAQSRLRSYQFIHETPAIATNYYRLLQLDLNGERHYSPVEKVILEAMPDVLSLLGNPVKTEALLQFKSSGNRKLQLILTDMSGKILLQKTWSVIPGTNHLRLATAHLPQGLYQIQVSDKNSQHLIKMVK